MTITNIGTAANTSGATVALTGVTVPPDALIIVAVCEFATGNASTGGSLSDSVNGAYVNGGALGNNGDPANSGFGNYFYFENSVALSGATITYTKNTSGSNASISAFYATGVSLIDGAVTVSTSGSSNVNPLFTLTSGAPATANELFVAIMTDDAGNAWFGQDGADGWGGPPTQISAPGASIAGGTQINSGTGAISFSPHNTGLTTVNYAAWILGFEPTLQASKLVFYAPLSPELTASKITSYAIGSPELTVSKTSNYAALSPQLQVSKLVGYAVLTPLVLTGVEATGQIGTVTPSISVNTSGITGVSGTGEVGTLSISAKSVIQPQIYIVT